MLRLYIVHTHGGDNEVHVRCTGDLRAFLDLLSLALAFLDLLSLALAFLASLLFDPRDHPSRVCVGCKGKLGQYI